MSLLTEEDACALASVSADPERPTRSDGYRRAAVFNRLLQRIQYATFQIHFYIADPIVGTDQAIIAPNLETLREMREELRQRLQARGFPPQLLYYFLTEEQRLLEQGRVRLETTARAQHRAVCGMGLWDTELCVVAQLLREMSPPR